MIGGAGLIPVQSASQLEAQTAAEAARHQSMPVITALAAHAKKRWVMMRDYKRQHIETRLDECTRARSMEYAPDKLAEIRSQGGSEIYMGVVSGKCRTATAWLRDALLGSGADKPWSIEATPIPEVPPNVQAQLQQIMFQNLEAYYAQGNPVLQDDELKQLASGMRDEAMRTMKEEAAKRVARMEAKMEDQAIEGGMSKAMYEFTNDVVTYPFAVMKGPVARRRRRLTWGEQGLEPVEVLQDEWERVDPYKFYWAPWGDDPQKMPVIEIHHLTREDVEDMIGMEGYDEASVREVLANFGYTGLNWLETNIVSGYDDVTGKDFNEAGDDLTAAVQLWDSIPGRVLLDWGLDESEVPDPHRNYPCEVWLVDNLVIRAELNYDPLGRKPYYVTSYEKVPGRVDGNGVADLVMDAQNMCNAAARAISNNMGIASGPQVVVNVSRLPNGEDITQMHPWKIWQVRQSDYGDTSAPMNFFQPNSNAQELMAVFDRYMDIADEMSGIPRYMTGQHVPGAGRTSSGLSMLISNAGKSIKQVISNIDHDVLKPMLERQYQRNLRYLQDPDMVGDVKILARGAQALVVKEAEAVRKSEFLRMVLESPVAQNIVGPTGTAELMRDLANNLGATNVDRLVPSREELEQRIAAQQAMAMQQMQQPPERQEDGAPQGGRDSNFISARPNGA